MEIVYKITVAVLVVSAMAGCSVMDSEKQEYIEARQVDDVPEDAPVISSDNESIRESEAIRNVVTEAADAGNGNAVIEVSSAEAGEARAALEPLLVYEGDPGGYYIRKDNKTFVILFLKEQ